MKIWKIWKWLETTTNSIDFFFHEPEAEVEDDTPKFSLTREEDITDEDRKLATFIVSSLNHHITECPLS